MGQHKEYKYNSFCKHIGNNTRCFNTNYNMSITYDSYCKHIGSNTSCFITNYDIKSINTTVSVNTLVTIGRVSLTIAT